MDLRLVMGAFLTSLAAAPEQGEPERPAKFQEKVANWTVVGDPDAGACLAMRDADAPTTLAIAALPADSDLVFSLRNDAWSSLKDEEAGKLWAHFTKRGELTDSWHLSIVSYNNRERGPVINFSIDRAANDGASFVEQFAAADVVYFMREKVPVASFRLEGSARAIDRLIACRAMLRSDKNFDPFAR